MKLPFPRGLWTPVSALLINLLWVVLAYEVCRLAFLFENWDTYAGQLSALSPMLVAEGILRFDLSAILYTNALYALMVLFPLHLKEREGWQRSARWVYVVINTLCLALNLMDAVYTQFTNRRTTLGVFKEFGNEGNLLGIMGTELVNHWYFVVLALALGYALWRLYVHPTVPEGRTRPRWVYYAAHVVVLAVYAFGSVCGMRGGYATNVRPITLSNANEYVNRPAEAVLILNTPFSIIRTIDKKPFVTPHYFTGRAQLDAVYSPLHVPADTLTVRRKNVVVLIVESMGREYVGSLNPHLDGGRWKGFAPFLDSLATQSLTFEWSFATGRKSIDGMPSVLSSIPMFVEPVFVTSAALNKMSGLAGELNHEGYHTAFFHGADNGSMGFLSFARSTGFQEYYGRTEYNADPRFGGDRDFDGTWSIWDEEFLQFYAQKMKEFRQPFMTSVFTASSHHPFRVPERYAAQFPEEGGCPLYKCVRYADMSLRRFFETARRQPWYRNTIFVITADHTNIPIHEEYRALPGLYSVPILFFDPSGELKPGRRSGIAAQIDIMPTVLHHLGVKRPYVAFGQDLLSTPAAETYSVGYANEQYFIIKGDFLLLFDGTRTTAVHNLRKDWLCRHNLVGKTAVQPALEHQLKAIIQSYMERMNGNHLTAATDPSQRPTSH